VRRWTMFSWFFLSFGLTLGMIWAYEELGWGGFWGWDPVENAGLLPWFTATAFLHSVMVQERRGMLRVWNVTLVIITFLLTIFGTFMTRSGVVQSVHAFGDDPALARLFLSFMAVVALFSFGWVIYRLPMLQARHELDSWVSREAAFLANNWILLFSAFFVLFAMANSGLPGTSGFVGEFLVIIAAFKANFWYAFLAATTLILGAAYTLWLVKRVVFGPVANDGVASLEDLNGREWFVLGLLAVGVLALGVYPAPLLEVMQESVRHLVEQATASKLP